ncbi:MAG TPA: cation:proton antiporter [Burkholderiaceae bacterium]
MSEYIQLPYQLAWPFALALAWILGELVHRWVGLPRISVYGLTGFVFGNMAAGFLPTSETQMAVLVTDVAFGLMLFEVGYRINLHWLRINPWIAVTGLVEAVGTFAAVYAVARWFAMSPLIALLLASFAMSTSPAGVLRVLNEQRSAGQVTERVLHLCAMNTVLAVFSFKVIVGFGLYQTSGNVFDAIWNSLAVLAVSIALGGLLGVAVPALLRALHTPGADATLPFAIAVILLVAVTHTLKFSPVLATLTFGLVARHRRITLGRTQRNFGLAGDLLALALFFFVSTTIEWPHVVSGLGLAVTIFLVRFIVKTAGVTAFAHLSGISWRKGLLTGMALSPMAVFTLVALEQTRRLGVDLVDAIAPLAALTLMMEVLGPVLTQRALILANETQNEMQG